MAVVAGLFLGYQGFTKKPSVEKMFQQCLVVSKEDRALLENDEQRKLFSLDSLVTSISPLVEERVRVDIIVPDEPDLNLEYWNKRGVIKNRLESIFGQVADLKIEFYRSVPSESLEMGRQVRLEVVPEEKAAEVYKASAGKDLDDETLGFAELKKATAQIYANPIFREERLKLGREYERLNREAELGYRKRSKYSADEMVDAKMVNTFAHELGHLLGAIHGPFSADFLEESGVAPECMSSGQLSVGYLMNQYIFPAVCEFYVEDKVMRSFLKKGQTRDALEAVDFDFVRYAKLRMHIEQDHQLCKDN